MIVPSHSPSVPLFRSLESGTVEQTLNQRNNPWNTIRTSSLKALACNVLERNKEWNKPGTAPSKSVPPTLPYSSACGTSSEVNSKVEVDELLYEFNERAAIAEYDGQQSSSQAQRIAYLDTFVSALVTLPQENILNYSQGNWLDLRIKEAKRWLINQGLEQPE